jgi:AAA family ATP:ADP antiporter
MVILVICVGLARLADRTSRRLPRSAGAPAADDDAPVGEGKSGFGLILANRYLMLVAALTLLLNVVNTSGEYLFGRYVVQQATQIYGAGAAAEAARGQFVGEMYSSLYSHVNLLGLLLQMFVVARLFKFLGVGRALFVHPLIAGTGYLMMLKAPSFTAMRWLKTVDNAVDYSVGNTTKQALWLPTTRQEKYKAKQAVDSFVVRAGDVIQAGIVYTGELASFTIPAFAAMNLVMTAAWIAVASGLNRRLRSQAGTTL